MIFFSFTSFSIFPASIYERFTFMNKPFFLTGRQGQPSLS